MSTITKLPAWQLPPGVAPMWRGEQGKFPIGTRVRAFSRFGGSRVSTVAEERVTSQGRPMFVLTDGGWFFATELKIAQ